MNSKRSLACIRFDVFPMYNDRLYQLCERYVDPFTDDKKSGKGTCDKSLAKHRQKDEKVLSCHTSQ